MKALLPSGGIVDHRFGILTAPNHKGVPIGIVEGMPWAVDLGVLDGPEWLKRFDPDVAFPWIDSMLKYRDTCLFVPVPDIYVDAKATIAAYLEWRDHMWPWSLAFIAQDGQEDLDFPQCDGWTTLFVGGSTEWKTSAAAVECIKRAQALDKRIHVGRVNWGKRYKMFARLEGSEDFTYDGTRQRFDGIEKTITAWAGYQAQPPLFTV